MITEAIIAAVLAGGVCSDHFENVSRFNPTELSDYQKCVHIKHDNKSGTVGDYLWFRSEDNKFTYVRKQEIYGKSRNEALKVVLTAVVSNGIDKRIAGLEADIKSLETALVVLNGENDQLSARITELEDEVEGLQLQLDSIPAIVSYEVTVDGKGYTVSTDQTIDVQYVEDRGQSIRHSQYVKAVSSIVDTYGRNGVTNDSSVQEVVNSAFWRGVDAHNWNVVNAAHKYHFVPVNQLSYDSTVREAMAAVQGITILDIRNNLHNLNANWGSIYQQVREEINSIMDGQHERSWDAGYEAGWSDASNSQSKGHTARPNQRS